MNNRESFSGVGDAWLQSFKLGAHEFPGIWRFMLPQGLSDLQFPAEKRATCLSCPKACYDNFRADYRCCTYHPRIPNFLLGFASQTQAGEAAVDELIARGMLLPEGLHNSPQQWLEFLQDQHDDTFGRSLNVLCPMLDAKTGFCRAHAFRNSVCSTYFCYKDHGSRGEQFWSALQTLGTQLEMRLGQWALRSIGFDVDGYFANMNALACSMSSLSSSSGWSQDALQSLWGCWYGKEKELLQACAKAIAEKRKDLWTIAQSMAIQEALQFDQALVASVPEDQRLELEADDDERDERIDLAQLWQDCLEAHEGLWSWPNAAFKLSPYASIRPNRHSTQEEIHASSKEFFLEYRFPQQGDTLDWNLPIDSHEKKLLELFAQRHWKLDQLIQEQTWLQSWPEARTFLCEMLQRKVLWSLTV